MSRNENRIAWILERVESLDEENRKFWNFRFGFLGVPAVVQTDPENLIRHERREEFPYVGWTIRGSQLRKQRPGKFDGRHLPVPRRSVRSREDPGSE